jgi:hypothetical protein
MALALAAAALAERVAAEGGVAAAVPLLRHDGDAIAGAAARLLYSLMEWHETETPARVAAAGGIVPAAVAGLSRPAGVAKAMAALLSRLAISSDGSSRVAAEPGLLAALISLADGDHAGAATEAVVALSQLAEYSKEPLMAATGCLVAALARPDDAKLAAWGLSDLSDGDDGRAERVAAEPGCVAGLVACLFSADGDVVEHAAAALGNFACSTDDVAARIAAAPGALRGLVDALGHDSAATVEDAQYVLQALAEDGGAVPRIIATRGSICRLSALTDHASASVVERAAILLDLVSADAAFTSSLETTPALLPGLLKLAASPAIVTARYALGALTNACTHGAADRVIQTPGSLAALAAALGSSDTVVASGAAQVLAAAAASAAPGAKQRIVDGGCLGPLVALHASADAAAARQAGRALAALAEEGGARLVMEPGCVAGCLARLLDSDDETAKHALMALAGMEAGGGERVAAADPAIFSRLVAAASRSDLGVAGAAAAALGALAEFSAALRKRAAASSGVIATLTALLCRCTGAAAADGAAAAAADGAAAAAAAAATAALKSLDGSSVSRKRART